MRDALTAIWASRAGLSEKELLEVLAPHAPVPTKGKGKRKSKDKGKTAPSLAPALWAPIRLALDDMLLESAGRLVFAHDYARIAVRDRYLPTWPRQRGGRGGRRARAGRIRLKTRRGSRAATGRQEPGRGRCRRRTGGKRSSDKSPESRVQR